MNWYESLKEVGHSFVCLDDRTGEKIDGPELDFVYDLYECQEDAEGNQQEVPDHIVAIDAQTSRVMMLVHDALSAEKQAEFRGLRPSVAGQIAWKCVR